MSEPSINDAEPCLTVTDGRVFLIKSKSIKESNEKEYIHLWMKKEINDKRRCRYCNTLLVNEYMWFLFFGILDEYTNIPELKDNDKSQRIIVWSCRSDHINDIIFITIFGDKISKIPPLGAL